MRRMFIVLILLAGLAVPAGAAIADIDVTRLPDITNAVLLEPGVVGGGPPSERDLEEAADQGIVTVIDLRTPEEGTEEEAALVQKYGLNYYNIPVTTETLSREQADRVAKLLSAEGNKPAILHCGSGNRVGALWAVVSRFHRGAGPEEAYEIGIQKGMRSAGLKYAVKEIVE